MTAQIDRLDILDIERVVAERRAVFATGRTRGLDWRQRQLDGLIRLLDECEDQIAGALAEDLGRGAAEAWIADIASTRGEAEYTRKRLRRWMRSRRVATPIAQWPASARVRPEPLGTVLIIGAWNYPIYLTLGPLVGAVAAGNCVVVKPSEISPATSALLARLLPHYLDPEAVVVVEGAADVTQQLMAQGFDHVLFTGGTEIGKKIMAAAAPTLTPVTLELGGKSPVVIAADADIAVAARRVAWMKTLNSGQTCVAPDYVLVERPVAAEFIARVSEAMREYAVNRPDSFLPIVNQRQFDRLVAALDATTGDIAAGGRSERRDLTIQATVVVDPDVSEPLMTEEIFGPLLPIRTVESLDEAIDFVTSRPKPLAFYGFTRSSVTRDRMIDAVPAGGVVINHVAMHLLVPGLPFGGIGASGMGAYHGKTGFDTFSHAKPVLVRTFQPDLPLVYPPYTDRALKIMRRVL